MKYQRKTYDEYAVQGYYYGWEDVCCEESYREARQRLKEYRENAPTFAHRIIKRRLPLERTSN